MTRDQLEGQWAQLRDRVQRKWQRLTAKDLDIIAGRHDELVGILQERYGFMRSELDRAVSKFEAEL